MAGQRLNRLRQLEGTRRLVRETRLSPECCIMPLFVRPGRRVREPIPSMPGQFRISVDELVKECRGIADLGILAVLLFGLPSRKDERASGASAPAGIIQQAVQAVKAALPGLLVITDVCLCAYTSHGHCGILTSRPGARLTRGSRDRRRHTGVDGDGLRLQQDGFVRIDHEATLEVLARTAVSHVRAGADLVAPSDMTDGNVAAIRHALDQAGFDRTPIMAYSAKFASCFYGPFRDAVGSSPSFGDRKSYQLDVANADEAVREMAADVQAGADLVIVKPALGYLDVVQRIAREVHVPVAAYNVSGEYAMVKAAAARGWLREPDAWMEQLVCIKRAGASLVITYWAKEAARLLRSQAASVRSRLGVR